MRALILAPLASDSLAALSVFAECAHEDWRETGTIWDPRDLGARLDEESFDTVVVERDFLFAETFEAAPGLRVAAICRAALNQIDLDAATEQGVVVVNTPGRNANAVAELAVGLMFSLARRIPEADRYVRGGHWESPSEPYVSLRGSELAGKTAGLLGFGATGRAVTALCAAMGMTVLAYDPLVGDDEIASTSARPVEFDQLLADADFVSLHAPAPPDGKPLIDRDAIGRMRTGAYLVNTASAELVDSTALADGLRAGKLAGAAVDVFETSPAEPGHPLLSAPNVVLTPHIGGATDETIKRHSRMIVDDLRRIDSGKRPVNFVNPAVWERRRGR